MSEKPKRRWFRFHLLTAVLMMLVAGGVLWLNVRVFRLNSAEVARGWPLPLYTRALPEGIDPETGFYRQSFRSGLGGAPPGFKRFNSAGLLLDLDPDPALRPFGLMLDFAMLVSAVAGAALISESIIRRREGRKT